MGPSRAPSANLLAEFGGMHRDLPTISLKGSRPCVPMVEVSVVVVDVVVEEFVVEEVTCTISLLKKHTG